MPRSYRDKPFIFYRCFSFSSLAHSFTAPVCKLLVFTEFSCLSIQQQQFNLEAEEMVGCQLYVKNTNWLSTLFHSEFFDSCGLHQEHRKNEKNVFCIDCRVGCCRHCMESHFLHRQFQICKYVYHDVVRLQEIQKHLDCSKIQTYKINGEKAIHLKPRPQPKDARPSTKAKLGASCEACARYLQDVPNRFCSIACKVSVELKDQSHNIIPFSIQEFPDLSWKENCSAERHSSENESSLSLTDMSEDTPGWINSALKPRRQLHKRKGVPRRAPLC
ncbi:protein RGF1 INDUCIBLE TRANSCRIPTION FACTOR 1-like [Populus nigra]|uniref:protein RGF1 INDUCIBLE TRANSCRIPTION FACTOR 1-like n=1 Tax=Populus nigra TaxID=3691 RepID=UPI002B274026|nr:protein RGF1 INDUCIBLE TRANSCRIPTION FACTOR 1-like [Populus nigra]